MIDADVAVIGGGPAGLVAALRAGDLGAKTVLLTRDRLGGMAAHDGPVPVRTLAHAARLLREARQLGDYGISGTTATLDYARLLARVREVVAEVGARSALRPQVEMARVDVRERSGASTFVDPHTIRTESGITVRAERVILCTGGVSRSLAVPGAEQTATHSDAWALRTVPSSLLVIGGGATGVQVASIFNAFGSKVQLFQTGPRILASEDHDVSTAITDQFERAGIAVRAGFGTITAFEKRPDGVRMRFTKGDAEQHADASLAVVAVGWKANTNGLGLDRAGVALDARGFVRVDASLQTSASHVFAAGDVTGRIMLVSQALQDGFDAATNALAREPAQGPQAICPVGSFTDPEYAKAGLTEAEARRSHDVVCAVLSFDGATRPIIDGRTFGLCKLIVDRPSHAILGCHVVGDRAVDIVQTAAVAMAADMRVDALARLPFAFPTYTGILGRVAAMAARQLHADRRDCVRELVRGD